VVGKREGVAAQVLRPLRGRLAQLVPPRGRAGAVDGLAVHLQPAADRAQRVLAARRDHAFGGRPDVEQVVAALAHDVDELEGDLAGRLPVVVVLAEAPGVVDRRGHLPRLVLHLGGYHVVPGRYVVAG